MREAGSDLPSAAPKCRVSISCFIVGYLMTLPVRHHGCRKQVVMGTRSAEQDQGHSAPLCCVQPMSSFSLRLEVCIYAREASPWRAGGSRGWF